MKKHITNLPASVKSRLLNMTGSVKSQYLDILQAFAIERLLYRLSKSTYSDRFVLKGALLLFAWDIPERRTTLDVDFLANYDNSTEKIAGVIKEVCVLNVENDGIVFDAETVSAVKIKEDAEYSGVRVRLIAFIERTRIPVQVDFGFGDKVYPVAEAITYPVLLDLPAPKLKGYPPETVISEKFEAMVKLGDLNSRMKDFYDVWLILRHFKPKKSETAKAIKGTFGHRKTALSETGRLFSGDIYDKSSDRQQLWSAFRRKNDLEKAPEYLKDIAAEIEEYLSDCVKLAAKGSK